MSANQIEVDDLLQFEAGLRRRRQLLFGLIVALGVGAAGVFVYSMRSASRSIEERGPYGVRVADVSSLSPEERAEVEQQLSDRGYRAMAPGNFACPAGMMPIAGSTEVPAFCVDEHDATNAEVAACIAAGKCAQPVVTDIDCEPVQTAPPDEPATCIDYKILDSYCLAAGRRYLSFDELDRAIHLLGGNAFVRCAASPL